MIANRIRDHYGVKFFAPGRGGMRQYRVTDPSVGNPKLEVGPRSFHAAMRVLSQTADSAWCELEENRTSHPETRAANVTDGCGHREFTEPGQDTQAGPK